jgi:hypothetical protein
MCVLYIVGDRTEPRSTPACISYGIDILPSIETLNFLCKKKGANKLDQTGRKFQFR